MFERTRKGSLSAATREEHPKSHAPGWMGHSANSRGRPSFSLFPFQPADAIVLACGGGPTVSVARTLEDGGSLGGRSISKEV